MRIAILGATSQIAKDLIVSLSADGGKEMHLFARRPEAVRDWMNSVGLYGRYLTNDFSEFGGQDFDVVINFVGVGNPAQAAAMGASIFDVTLQYDNLVLDYLQKNPECKYLFLSSGAAYGSRFAEPATSDTLATVPINNLTPQDWYGAAKLHAECRHRAHPELAIVDIRVFNYFSHTQDLSSRFLVTDILRAIHAGETLSISAENIVRDYIGPGDFHRLVSRILATSPANDAVDCYTLAPVDKMTLLQNMKDRFGLVYEVKETSVAVNATGMKMNYYSKNRRAETFGYFPEKSSLDNVLEEMRMVNWIMQAN